MDIYPLNIYKRNDLIACINQDNELIEFINSNCRINERTKFIRISEDFRSLIKQNMGIKITAVKLCNLSKQHGIRKLNTDLLIWRGYTKEEAENILQNINESKVNLYDYKEVMAYRSVDEKEAKRQVEELLAKNITPRNKEYFIRQGYSEEESIKKVSDFQSLGGKKFGESIKDNPEKYDGLLTVHLKYWTDRYGEELGAILYKDRQSTFSLDLCISKYGKEKGTLIWKERQEKWQNTINSKDDEELKRINVKRGKNRHGVPHSVKRTGTDPTNLYYLRFYNSETSFYKVGITVNDIEERFWRKDKIHSSGLKYEIILIKKFEKEHEAYLIEQKILKENDANRIRVDFGSFITTEAFSKDILIEKYI